MTRLTSVARATSLTGLIVAAYGCVFEIEPDEARCFEAYFDCLDDSPPSAHGACLEQRDACLSWCDTSYDADDCSKGDDDCWSEDDDEGDDAGLPISEDSEGGARDSGGDDTGDDSTSGSSDSDGQGGEEPDDACFTLHVNCVARATTIYDVDACETLFDQCVDAGSCGGGCEPTCPDPEIVRCLDEYVECADGVTSVDELDACMAGFDSCSQGLSDETCVPSAGPEVVEPCLEQHALCVECVEDSADLVVCRDVFEACVSGS